MGIAGSGKGTQGKMLADRFGFHLLSMGDILRMYLTGEQRAQILSGRLLSDEETIAIVDKVLASIPDQEEILLDGFPRTIPQAEWLKNQSESGRLSLKFAFHLVASRDAVKERLLKRARIDDKEDAIESRFDQYEKSTIPLIKWLEDNGVKVYSIKAERSVEEVNDELVDIIKKTSN